MYQSATQGQLSVSTAHEKRLGMAMMQPFRSGVAAKEWQ